MNFNEVYEWRTFRIQRVTASVEVARKDGTVNSNKNGDNIKTDQQKNADANKNGQTADDTKKKIKRLVNF